MAKEEIKFLLIREVKTPTRAFEFDAGIDFFVPRFNSNFIDDLLEKNKKTFKKTLTEEEIEKLKPKHKGTGFGCDDGTTLYLNTTGNAGIGTVYTTADKSGPQDFFGFDVEKGEPYFILPAGHGVMIPSGVKSRMAKPGRALVAANKSGIATKDLLTFGAQVVDYTYNGEIHLHLINNSLGEVKIYQNQKILQFLETPVFNSRVKTITRDEDNTEKEFYHELQYDRGEGGFGSTDKK